MSTQRLPTLDASVVAPPGFPERAIQFGTGALLRGLVDAILDDANRAGQFRGRVVAVGSTGSGRDDAFNRQNGLFTLRSEGLVNGVARRDSRVVSSVSRALSATEDWDAVLECARNPALDVVFSNTTEVGIALAPDDARALAGPPRSFPAKLTRFLETRARAFDYAREKGVVVIPCELIERNGDALRDLVLTLSRAWQLGPRFTEWVGDSVRFCNTLVDRIVTGSPPPDDHAIIEQELGYRDALMTECEPYGLLVVEGDDALRERLPFARPEFGVLVVDDVTPYRERKVRLLNGGHTAMVSLALIAGIDTVRDATEHRHIGRFLRHTVLQEILPTVPGDAEQFAREVLDRFANPFIEHRLWDITLHGGAKMRVRVVPSIVEYTTRNGHPPARLSLGFAAYLLFARSDALWKGNDDSARRRPDEVGDEIKAAWKAMDGKCSVSLTRTVCQNVALWGVDLDALPGFTELVSRHLMTLERDCVLWALDSVEVQADLPPSEAHKGAVA